MRKRESVLLIMILWGLLALRTDCFGSQYNELGNAPAPKCQSNFFYKTLPLTGDEGYILDLDRIFTGYNLSFSLEGAEEVEKNLTLKQKMKFEHREIPDQQLLGFRSYHLDKTNNVWGKYFIALTARNDKSYIHFGVLNSNTSAPVINNVVTVQSFTNTTCYDAVLFPEKDLILVDCAVRLQKPNAKGQIIQNIFYYFKFSDGSPQKTVRTEMYINFQKITRRSLEIYSELLSEHTFLLRTYYADGVDGAHAGNTYIDVFMISEPDKPWIVELIDRSYFRADSLRIADIKIYLGQIYVLDDQKGIYRLRITTQEDLAFQGHYEAKGFTRFTVFSNNLDDSFELALANTHSVYQIDWSEIDAPKLLNKYSLMPGSKVNDIFLNNRFVVVHSVTNFNETLYNYTWVFTRGSRTYSNAFLTISHNTSEAFVDFNQGMSHLIVMDSYQFVNYKIDSGNLIIRLAHDEDYLDRMMNFTIKGTSNDFLTPQGGQECHMILNFTLLEDNNRTMWPIGLEPPSDYVANYPGKVVIPLYQYVLGPNITYVIKETEQGTIKKSKIYQNEQLVIKWEKQPPTNKTILFLRTETATDPTGDVLFIYMQDNLNVTYISYCLPKHEDLHVYCNETIEQDFGGKISNWASSIFFSRYTLSNHHVVAYTLTSHLNRIYLLDLDERREIDQVNLGKGYAGQITSVQITERYMFVVLRYIKTVQVYDLELCLEGLCQPIDQITHLKMYNLGVTYFSPKSVHTSKFHPNVIFIKTADKIVALDVDREGVPVLLASVTPVPDTETDFQFKMNLNSMIVTILPSTIQEYDISRIYFKEVTKTKRYPMYGTHLPRDYTFDVSDYGTAVYVTTVNEADNRFVYVLRSGLPAVASLLNIMNLYIYSNALLDVTGFGVDYVTVLSEQQIRIFRQHEIPLAEVESAEKDYKFVLQYSNTATKAQLETISVEIINLPTNISVAPFLEDIMNTKDLLHSGINRLSEINDTDWYTGNVLRIYPECHDCDSKVKIMNHIHDKGLSRLLPFMYEFKWSMAGGTFQQAFSTIHVHHNGSIRNIVALGDDRLCITLTVKLVSHYEVSGCLQSSGFVLQLVSLVAQDKPFAFEPYLTKAKNMFKLGSAHELIMLVDTTSNPFYKTQPGGVFIYAVDEDLDAEESLIELEYFDGYDIGGDDLGFIYIVNAHLAYVPETKIYRLYITDITKGLIVIEFIYARAVKEIVVKHVNFIDMPKLLAAQHKKIPYDATYQAVALLSSHYDPNDRQYYQNVLITTGLYHTFQLYIIYGINGLIKSVNLAKVFLRYSFYIVDNDIEFYNGLFVVRQYLPKEMDNGTYNRQILTVYDSRGQFNGTTLERGLIGAYLSNDTFLHNFDFNLTYDPNDLHKEPRTGLLMVEYGQDQYQKLSLHRNLSVLTSDEVDTQIIYIDLYNDFSLKKIRILLNGYAPFPEWVIVAIILFSIVGVLLLAIIGFIIVRRIREGGVASHDMEERDSRGSLLTDQ